MKREGVDIIREWLANDPDLYIRKWRIEEYRRLEYFLKIQEETPYSSELQEDLNKIARLLFLVDVDVRERYGSIDGRELQIIERKEVVGLMIYFNQYIPGLRYYYARACEEIVKITGNLVNVTIAASEEAKFQDSIREDDFNAWEDVTPLKDSERRLEEIKSYGKFAYFHNRWDSREKVLKIKKQALQMIAEAKHEEAVFRAQIELRDANPTIQ